jgi:hypothetical protein
MIDDLNINIQSKNINQKPILSIILCSRNDHYMGNSLWRLETSLNYLALCVNELGKEKNVEVLVTDWGSRTPLYKEIKLTPMASKIVSFVVVPPDLARQTQKDSPFSEVHALNAAARRASGEYIGRIDQDILIGKRFLRTFFEMVEKKPLLGFDLDSVVLFANRRSIPYRFAVRCPSFEIVESFIDKSGKSLTVWGYNPWCPTAFWTSYVGILLLNRKLWFECGGYNEEFIYYDWMETEMIVRLKKKYPVVNLGALVGNHFFHLDHYNPDFSSKTGTHLRAKGVSNPYVDIEQEPEEFHPNDKDWGLNQEDVPVVYCANNCRNIVKPKNIPVFTRWLSLSIFLFTIDIGIVFEKILNFPRAIRKHSQGQET